MPSPSPTTTRAVKLKRRPPWTILATRLMATTRSTYWLFSAPPRRSSRPPPRRSPPERCPRWGPLMRCPLPLLLGACQRCQPCQPCQNVRPPSRAASARAATRPWYLLPARSKTTESMPAPFARSATSSPTLLALAVLSPSSVRRSASMVEAETSVLPWRSSTTWTLMCLEERVTTSRGRSAVPWSFLRPRTWRCRRAFVRDAGCLCLDREIPMSLTSLSDLAADVLAGVAHALALVGLGLAELADVRGDLADQLLVDALDAEVGRVLDGERDALGRLEGDRVAVAELELQLGGALGQDAVAHAHDLELLLVALGDTDDHVVDERAGEAVAGTALALVVGTGHGEDTVLLGHGDRGDHGVAQRALGALDRHQRAVDRDVDTRGHDDGHSSDARHVSSLLFGSRATRRRRGLPHPRPSGWPDGRSAGPGWSR